jgi:diguanylate cyclase (GGDEF)-like protein
VGRATGLVLAAVAALASFTADLSDLRGLGTGSFGSVGVAGWNGLMRLGSFTAVALLTGMLRSDRDRLRQLNAALEAQVQREAELARTDPLTGLPNLRALVEALTLELARVQRDQRALALVYLDLDNFKQVNDRYGHRAGDRLLQQVATAVTDAVRAGDLPARIGGDEFAVVVVGRDAVTVMPPVTRILQRVAALAQDYPGCAFGASIGIADAGEHAGEQLAPIDAARMLAAADQALYTAKAQGKGRAVIVTL